MTRPVEESDILVVAPYNAQVRMLRSRLPGGVAVGTVDKFQGQQAPVVFVSMASSSSEEAPRGIGFAFDPNRFNVATSRAQCRAVLVVRPRASMPTARPSRRCASSAPSAGSSRSPRTPRAFVSRRNANARET